jgi:transglutaminase-like putative cysteine protease
MRYRIEHWTNYHYARTAVASQQLLRLSPRRDAHQWVTRWTVRAPGSLSAATDAYDNLAHMHTLSGSHGSLRIEAFGEVEVDALCDGRLEESGGLPPPVFAAMTPLTAADARLRDLAGTQLRGHSAANLLDFARAVARAASYRPGTTHVRTTSAEALAQGQGVCQDHAHVFIAGCRAVGIPARYVSGYYYREAAGPDTASHAWADAWVTGEGWVSIDITHGCFASDALVRLAIGRDYDTACPVRGVRVGGGAEAMETRVVMQREDAPVPHRAAAHDEGVTA